MRLSYERRQKLTDLLQTVAGAVILIILVALAVWACSAMSPSGSGRGCNRAYCVEDGRGVDGPDHPDLEDVYDYDPLDDQMRQQQLDEADRRQNLEDARQEGYEEGYEDGQNGDR